MLQQSAQKTPEFFQFYQADHAAIKNELVKGLVHSKAFTSPKYLYDELGSKLFEAITCLPEYYPTRTEALVFEQQRRVLASTLPQGACLIDLGAGNCNKAASLFSILNPVQYMAVDISTDFLRLSLQCLQRQFPALDMKGVGMDFSSTLEIPDHVGLDTHAPRIVFYPGSSIGNFSPEDALVFLKQTKTLCSQTAGGGLLIGVDLVKEAGMLQAAYDDALGVTAAFNRNLLLHINRLTGSNFDISGWQHIGIYNEAQSRIEMHLEASRDVTVNFDDNAVQRHFLKGERIHTENSYKWTVDNFTQLLGQAGFAHSTVWTDPNNYFAVVWAQVRKPA